MKFGAPLTVCRLCRVFVAMCVNYRPSAIPVWPLSFILRVNPALRTSASFLSVRRRSARPSPVETSSRPGAPLSSVGPPPWELCWTWLKPSSFFDVACSRLLLAAALLSIGCFLAYMQVKKIHCVLVWNVTRPLVRRVTRRWRKWLGGRDEVSWSVGRPRLKVRGLMWGCFGVGRVWQLQ